MVKITITLLFSKPPLTSHHLHGSHILLLLHVDVGNVEPDVAEVGRGLAHLGKHVTRLVDAALVGQHAACQGARDCFT